MSEVSETGEQAIVMVETFGEKLRRFRKARNLSQAQLGSKAKTNQGHIADLENSRIINPGSDLMSRLARALGISIEELSGQSGGSLPPYIESFSHWLAEKNVTEHQLTFIQRIAEIYLEEQQAPEQPKVS
jgi:transcriptional regulator with XRE-family HTH domain